HHLQPQVGSSPFGPSLVVDEEHDDLFLCQKCAKRSQQKGPAAPRLHLSADLPSPRLFACRKMCSMLPCSRRGAKCKTAGIKAPDATSKPCSPFQGHMTMEGL